MKAIFIKLGGSLITDKTTPMSVKESVIDTIAAELSTIYQNNPETVLIIGNGAGSFGHFAVHKTNWKENKKDPMRIAEVRQITTSLNSIVLKHLVSKNIPTISFSPSSFLEYRSGKMLSWLESVFHFVSIGITPLVFGDVIFDANEGSRIISTEEVLEVIAQKWIKDGNTIESFVYCTSVDGVLDNNSKTIPKLLSTMPLNTITETKGFDVTGGMAQKVLAGYRALEYCDRVYIINGSIKGNLTKAINKQDIGTQLSKN